jgi:hypothetical protein
MLRKTSVVGSRPSTACGGRVSDLSCTERPAAPGLCLSAAELASWRAGGAAGGGRRATVPVYGCGGRYWDRENMNT